MLKNSSKLVMGIGAVLIVFGFMVMGQCVENLLKVTVFLWTFLLILNPFVKAPANGSPLRSRSQRSSVG